MSPTNVLLSTRLRPLHHTSATVLLRHYAKEGVVEVGESHFAARPYYVPHSSQDLRDAFVALTESLGYAKHELEIYDKHGLLVSCTPKLFQDLHEVIFSDVSPTSRPQTLPHHAPLPTIFIGDEKTQVRQIPYADGPPWPYHFLLELGGMIIVRAPDPRAFISGLRQFLNNYPQLEVRVDAKEWPGGEMAVFTWWCQRLKGVRARQNINVERY